MFKEPPRSWCPGHSAVPGKQHSSALPPPPPCPITAPALGVRGKFCPEHGVETAPARSGGAEHPSGTVWGEGTRFPPLPGDPVCVAGPGAQVWELPGSSSRAGVGPIDLQLACWAGQGAGTGGGAASSSPHGCPGAPCAPSRSLGRVGIAGQGEPCLLLIPRALAWHSLVLAAPLPQREAEIAPGPLGCDSGLGVQGGAPPGVLLLPSREDPHEDEEEAPVWQGCSAATSVHAAWTERIQAAKWGGGTAGGSAVARGVPAHDISCPCSQQQVEPAVPVRSRPPAPPEPPLALL